MQGKIRFSYDIENDIVVATTLGVELESEADVLEWYKTYHRYLKRFGRKVDLVIDLSDGFVFKPSIGAVFGQYRLKIHEEFSRSSCRVKPNSLTKLFVQTSAIAGQAIQTADCYDSVDEAKRAIIASRAATSSPPARSGTSKAEPPSSDRK